MHFLESERTACRCAGAGVRRVRVNGSALDVANEKKIGREEHGKKTCSFATRKWERERERVGGREGERERMISKNGATLARWKRGVIEGWLTILRVFPPPMAVALPTGALPHPFLQPLSPFSTSQKPSPSSSSSPYRLVVPPATALM